MEINQFDAVGQSWH